MNEFKTGFIQGAKESPRIFFAPAIALWRLLVIAIKFVADAAENKSKKA